MRKYLSVLIITSILLLTLSGIFTLSPLEIASAQATTLTAYKATLPVTLGGVYSASQWSDTPLISETNSGMTVAFKQNESGLLFLLIWNQSSPYCTDKYCFGGIELGHLNNTAEMGSPSTPTIMILVSLAFNGSVDEFISTGEQTPESVESAGYRTQSTCVLGTSGTQYTAECYRPFSLTDASPYDFPNLTAGSTIEIGFAVGEFSQPGTHVASDMSTYTLTISGQTYTATTTTSSLSQSSSSLVSNQSVSYTSTNFSSTSTSSIPVVTSSSSSTTSSSAISSTSTITAQLTIMRRSFSLSLWDSACLQF